ncbi:DegT/DnrJ/EryC1/StrS family aminotransferase, partial [Mycobacterium tuberculosis]|uniref:DegT/DnrJ/EryC1/StrS family aminotransferase n=1 Tax=Mycobacterium tuberculosis TaxID=1773 RepID=UPI003C6E8DDE
MALLLALAAGAAVLLPSSPFVSPAPAFVLRGGVPVFVALRPAPLPLAAPRLVAALPPRPPALVPVPSAGVACALAALLPLAPPPPLAVVAA